MNYITLEQLLAKRACRKQIVLFESLFPKGRARVTIKRAKALSGVFDWDWAARNLLSPGAREAYLAAVRRSAREAYEAVRRSAWEAYEAVERPAREAYEAIRRPAWEAYEAIRRPAWEAYEAAVRRSAREAYEAVRRSAWEAYEASCAEAFARAYLSMEEGK